MVVYGKIIISGALGPVVEHLVSVQRLDPGREVDPEIWNHLRHVADDESC